MSKELFKWVVALIYQPGKAWRELAKKEEKDDEYLLRFVYPLIGLVTIAAFIGVLFAAKEFNVELALKTAVKVFVSHFGGFFLSAYLLNEIWISLFKQESDLKLCQRFVGYSSAMIFALNIILSLLPVSEFFFLHAFTFYTIYIVLEGTGPYMKVAAGVRMKFIVIASVLIMSLPVIIGILLYMLMPGLRV